jgi:hypothetical protein
MRCSVSFPFSDDRTRSIYKLVLAIKDQKQLPKSLTFKIPFVNIIDITVMKFYVVPITQASLSQLTKT